MTKTEQNKSLLYTIAFVIILGLLVLSIPSEAQQNLYAYNISTGFIDKQINSPSTGKCYEYNLNNEIINLLRLTSKEKDLLKEIKELSKESKQWLKEADKVNNDVQDLYKIIKISKNFPDIHSKAIRKSDRFYNYEMSLRYDAEEFMQMSNSMLFNLYENHLPTNDQILSNGFDNYQKITELNDEAQDLFKKARKHQEKAYYDYNYKVGIEYLAKANSLEIEALKKQELAFALYYDMPISEKFNDLADLNKNIDDETAASKKIENKIEKENKSPLFELSNEPDIPNIESKSIETNLKANNNIIFKVQIGAFINDISKEEFHGLSPLSIDNKDQEVFNKYMVGKYYSYKAACESKKIIVSNTDYKDAFVVAYVNGKRMPIDVVLSEYKQ